MDFESQCLAALKLAKDAPTYPLPSVRHLTYKDYASVYEPSDDTFLLIDAIYHDVPLSLRTSTRGLGEPVVTVELGSGSGVNVVAIAKATRGEGGREGGGKFYATDINDVAARTTEKTIEENGPWGEDEEFGVFVVDLLGESHSPPPPFWSGPGVDFCVFNPPYVPTPDDEVGGCGIEASWAGGKDGRVVIDRAMGQIGKVLRGGGGVCYMITVDDNRPEELIRIMKEEHGLGGEVLMRRKARNEMLSVLKFIKP